ncbi:hypothetical protein Aph02nite_71950 [Actinoplanes philippinensis]|uniref:Uncharacterized protein n=1 Tax=Actinoplanes philippinensis TaxID=35752 RepID=A0A1I2JY30_9ACTN|nr:hypothetical protein [Actinoplanes philippinensis]GIE81245.1 hypothetical protein Aph02nite_71950 [Actinoplanes philippinensis]SFF59053.1 hypothetical protein SAMN05421541_114116 [Actinoplanes philippinensis]
MSAGQSREDRAATLTALLREVQVAEYWQPHEPTGYIATAVRRWTTSDRRIKPGRRTPENRVRDLLRGLREAQGANLLHEEPGWLEHLADRFGAALLEADAAPDESGGRHG